LTPLLKLKPSLTLKLPKKNLKTKKFSSLSRPSVSGSVEKMKVKMIKMTLF
jgi:hypothetical protein